MRVALYSLILSFLTIKKCRICENVKEYFTVMAIERYSSLASNRNYKIHNASKRARRTLAYMYRRAGFALGTKPTSTNKIILFTPGELFTNRGHKSKISNRLYYIERS